MKFAHHATQGGILNNEDIQCSVWGEWGALREQTGRAALPCCRGREGREVLELSYPSLVVQDLVESMAMRDFKDDKDNGYLKLLPVKNFGE